jgi:hypothetical protein
MKTYQIHDLVILPSVANRGIRCVGRDDHKALLVITVVGCSVLLWRLCEICVLGLCSVERNFFTTSLRNTKAPNYRYDHFGLQMCAFDVNNIY